MSAEKAKVVLESAFGLIVSSNPQIYDVFWTKGGQISVPWENPTNRSIKLEKNVAGLWVNASPLPGGVPAFEATFAGCIYCGPFQNSTTGE